MQFRSFKELENYCKGQMAKGNIKFARAVTDEILIAEADRLRSCIQKYIDEYYESFEASPAQTGELREALTAQTVVQSVGGKRCIGVYFDPSKSWGMSLVTGEMSGYKPVLANYGYKDKSFKNPNFYGYSGFHFIERGIQDWESTLQYDIDLEFADTSLEVIKRII